jgi:PKD repeat protein
MQLASQTSKNLPETENNTMICDSLGKIILYYDGKNIYNKNFNFFAGIQVNEDGESSRQTGLFIPYPGRDSLYYLFCVKENEYFFQKDSLVYHPVYYIIDVKNNKYLFENGIEYKKIKLASFNALEVVTGRKTCYGYEILYKEHLKSNYIMFKIDDNGLDTNYNIINIPMVNDTANLTMSFTYSNSGKLLLDIDYLRTKYKTVGSYIFRFKLYDVSDNISIIDTFSFAIPSTELAQNYQFYSGAFSPNDSLIYIVTFKSLRYSSTNAKIYRQIWQYNIKNGINNVFRNKKIVYYDSLENNFFNGYLYNRFFSIRTANDGNIYIPDCLQNKIYKIISPDTISYITRLNYVQLNNIFPVNYFFSSATLPNIIPSAMINNYVSAEVINADTIVCINKAVRFKDNSWYKPKGWYWEFGDGTFSTERNPTHIYTKPGTYEVSLSVAFECSTKTTQIPYKIHVGNCPVADFTYLVTDSCNVYAAHIVSNSQYAVNQEFKIEDKLYTDSVFTHMFTQNGTYVVALKVKNQYGQDSISKTIEINNPACESSLFVPNVFTPNGDNINDTWHCTGEYITQFEATIFNRWGQQVFTTQDINQAWDANSYSEGVYFLILKAQGLDGKVYEHKGFVQVLR